MTFSKRRIYPAEIEVDLDALAANTVRMKEFAGESELLAVVKANGYGVGRRQVAQRLCEEGIRWFGVSRYPEALALREQFDALGIARDQVRILTWLNTPDQDWQGALAAQIDVSVSTLEQLRQVTDAHRSLAAAGLVQGPARIHLKVDVGMGRGGATLEELPALADAVREAVGAGEVELVGFWSHLSYADDPTLATPSVGTGRAGLEQTTDPHARAELAAGPALVTDREPGVPPTDSDRITADQVARYLAGLQIIRERELEPEFRHLAASSGTVWHPETRFDLVRPGIALYGFSPNAAVASSAELGLKPVCTYRTPIMQVKQVEPGDTVSYGATWVAEDRRWIGLLPVGYADGVPRALSGTGARFVLEESGAAAPLLGRVCMDQMVLDLGTGAEPAAQVGDSVVLFGDPTAGHPSVDDWATAAGTIDYEVIARLPEHIRRRHIGTGGPPRRTGIPGDRPDSISELERAPQGCPTEPASFLTHDAEATRALGARLGSLLRRGDVLLLVGDLGAGKTTFTQGLARGLNVEGRVTSPTYIIARAHDSLDEGPTLVHVDAYRVGDELDLETIDLDATVEDSVTVIEWGRGHAESLSDERLEIEFNFAEAGGTESRTIVLRPVGEGWEERLREAGLA